MRLLGVAFFAALGRLGAAPWSTTVSTHLAVWGFLLATVGWSGAPVGARMGFHVVLFVGLALVGMRNRRPTVGVSLVYVSGAVVVPWYLWSRWSGTLVMTIVLAGWLCVRATRLQTRDPQPLVVTASLGMLGLSMMMGHSIQLGLTALALCSAAMGGLIAEDKSKVQHAVPGLLGLGGVLSMAGMWFGGLSWVAVAVVWGSLMRPQWARLGPTGTPLALGALAPLWSYQHGTMPWEL
jgi:hypothetical protein